MNPFAWEFIQESFGPGTQKELPKLGRSSHNLTTCYSCNIQAYLQPMGDEAIVIGVVNFGKKSLKTPHLPSQKKE